MFLFHEERIRAHSRSNQNQTNFNSPMSGINSKSSGLPRRLGSALCSTHSLSSRLQVALLHGYYCSWWSSHCTGISKRLGSSCCSWAALSPIASQRLSTWCPASTSLYGPFIPEPSTATDVVPGINFCFRVCIAVERHYVSY